MTISAVAKINGNLRILRIREDGYHELETLMIPLSLHDTLEVDLTDDVGIDFSCDDLTVPLGSDNLVVRAAEMFFSMTGQKGGVRIHLTKRIPVQAGLGGGSSDAAATLCALNRLCDNVLPLDTIEMLAGKLGADAAWFVRGEAAVCRGRGELIGSPVPLPPLPILLIKPPFGVSTPWAYRAWDCTKAEGGSAKVERGSLKDSNDLKGFNGQPTAAPRHSGAATAQVAAEQVIECGSTTLRIFNDLEIPVFTKYPILEAIKEWLLARPQEVVAAGMSGSGSTMFAILRDEHNAPALAHQLRQEFGDTMWVFY